MDTLQSIVGDYKGFLKQLLQELVEAGFDLQDFVQLDHMCYRTPSLEQYHEKKQQLAQVGKLLDEAQINGRPIAVFRLDNPIHYGQWRIDALEVPAPRQGRPTQEGLEHVEFVLYDDKDTFLRKYAGKEFDLHAVDRGVNPEIAYKLPSYGVKFHLLNLPTAVYLQLKTGLVE